MLITSYFNGNLVHKVDTNAFKKDDNIKIGFNQFELNENGVFDYIFSILSYYWTSDNCEIFITDENKTDFCDFVEITSTIDNKVEVTNNYVEKDVSIAVSTQINKETFEACVKAFNDKLLELTTK